MSSSLCGGCGKKILSGSIVTALDQQFHARCFLCGLCAKELDGPFYGCDNIPFCEACIDRAEELDKKGQLRSSLARAAVAASESPVVAVAPPVESSPPKEDPFVAPSSPPSSSNDDHICHKCNTAITSGTVVNALDTCWHEVCFRCTDCHSELDAFYNFGGFPFCGNCIDAAEERGTVAAAPPSGGPKITNAFANKPGASASPPTQPAAQAPPVQNAASSFSSSFSALPPPPPATASWQERALLAEEQVRQLHEKLAMVKVALSEERRISAEEYNALQRELEQEKSRREMFERSQASGGKVDAGNEEVLSLRNRVKELEKDLSELRSRQQNDNRLSEALLELEQSQKRYREVSNRLRETEQALEEARLSGPPASSAPEIPGPPGGGPPPPPPPPPPPAVGLNTAPLKINRTGQSAAMTAKEDESNPQADLINELKKGRPMLRRAAAQRPSKREILTKNANARMAETERPDPSVVKGVSSDPSAKKMARAAEKTAELAVERDDRVKTGNIKMKVHRNKFLDQFLDTL